MIFSLVENDLFVELTDLAVDACPNKTVLMQLFEFLLKFTLAAPNKRRKDHHPLSFFEFVDTGHDLINRLACNRSVALMTMRLADA